jgi:hypothetical protein
MVATVTQVMAIATTAMLSGQAAIPRTVSGLTTLPSAMPRMTKNTRATGRGKPNGRPSNAAIAQNIIAPASHPAGNRAAVKMAPPATPMSSVSTARSESRRSCPTPASFLLAGDSEQEVIRLSWSPRGSATPHTRRKTSKDKGERGAILAHAARAESAQ